MGDITTRDLISQLQDKLIIQLNEDEMLCPECKGLLFKLIESEGNAHIEHCRYCYTGKLTICKHCGKAYKSQCDCQESTEERYNKFLIEQSQREQEAFQNAEKIDYKDYSGYFILGDGHVKESEELEEWIEEKLFEGEILPEYLWAVEGTQHFSIDLQDVIYDKCEDGYEDMESCLDTNSPLLSQAQELINQWEKEQGGSLFVYNETYKKAVIIKDLVEKIASDILWG